MVSCATRSTCAGSSGAILTSSSSDARNSSRLADERAARARSARCEYISPRRRSSSVTRARSKAHTWARKPGISSARAGNSSASTCGAPASTSRTSLGLSSTRIKVSRPSSSSSASDARLPALESQLMRCATKSPGASGISGCARKVATTSSGLFLLHRASSIPARRRSAISSCSARRGASSTTPSGPSSPQMPAHRVSSQSSAIALNGGAVMAWIFRASAVARATK